MNHKIRYVFHLYNFFTNPKHEWLFYITVISVAISRPLVLPRQEIS